MRIFNGKASDSAAPEATPNDLKDRLEACLLPDESQRFSLEIDLDEGLHFCPGLLVLTSRRLISISKGSPENYKIGPELELRCRDSRDTDSLELIRGTERLRVWRFTAARRAAAHRFERMFERLRHGDLEEDELNGDGYAALCSGCGTALSPDQILCPQCEAAQSRQSMKSILRVLSFGRKRFWAITLGLTLQILGTAAALIPPYLTIPMIDEVLIPYQSGASVDFSIIWLYMAGLFGAQVLSWLLTWGRTWVLAWASERIAADLRNTTYEHMQKLSVEYFGGRRTGDLISRVGGDTDRICYFLSVHLLDFVSDILTIAMTAGILIWIDPMLALVTLVPLPLIGWLVHVVRRRLVTGFTQGSMAWSELTSVLADTIPGIRVVKAFAQERREIERFRQVNNQVLAANDRVNTLWAFFSSIVAFLTGLGVLFVWGFGAWMVFKANVKVGVLTGFVQYISRFYGRMDSMSRMVSAFQRAGVAAQRVFSILDRVPSVPEPVNPVHPGTLRGQIEFRNVNFHYGRQPVLRDLNFSIAPGEMIGLIGPSGTGKTTLINLLCRFYDVKEGAILVDGVDIRSYPIEEFRKNIGIVLQEPFLFYGSIAENIAYGRPEASRAELIAAARAARAHEFILKLPDGYDSIVGERGQSLSGGERQRISIARALLINPRILILDEATSSVDNDTEREIQLALANLIKGRTTVAIAHRLQTLRRATRLLRIEHGRLARIASPEEILPAADTSESLQEVHESEGSSDPVALAARGFTLKKNSLGELSAIDADGRTYQPLEPVRAFPLSAPHEFVSLLDAKRREILRIADLRELPALTRGLLEADLSLREFVPVIERIVHADTKSIPARWEVQTSRGPTTIFIDSEDDMRRLGEHRALFVDTHGIRYLIPDFRTLDKGSRDILNVFF